MQLPQRVPQHISESASFKIFANHIPDNWIVRDVTERDYGVDCYVELVNEKNQLTGDLASIQLKSKDTIDCNLDNTLTISNIKISTSNYWYRFPVPVFLCVTDNQKKEMYFVSVKNFIKKNFFAFAKQKTFNYSISKDIDFFDKKSGPSLFRLRYAFQDSRNLFENEMKTFLSTLEHYHNFQDEHNNRDYHLPIESVDLIFFEAMHRNYFFIADYLLIEHPILSLRELKLKSKQVFKDDYYELYEHDLAQVVEDFRNLSLKIIKGLKQKVEAEKEYWITIDLNLFNYVTNIKDNGELPQY